MDPARFPHAPRPLALDSQACARTQWSTVGRSRQVRVRCSSPHRSPPRRSSRPKSPG